MSETAKTGGDDLPKDILLEVFHRLPIKSLMRLKCLSKEWNYTISDPIFMETNRARRKGKILQLILSNKFDISTVEHSDLMNEHREIRQLIAPLKTPSQLSDREHILLGSYNGLVATLLCAYNDCEFVLWNPLTSKSKSFSGFSRNRIVRQISSSLFGLCCLDDVGSDSYSAVVVVNSYPTMTINVLNFKTGELTTRTVPAYQVIRCNVDNLVGTVVRGIPHWMRYFYGGDRDQEWRDIIWFDSKNMLIQTMPGVPKRGTEGKEAVIRGLGSLDEGRQLCVTFEVVDKGNMPCWLEVWVMKEYGNSETWSNVFVIQSGIRKHLDCMNVLEFMENGEYLVHVSYDDEYYKVLFGYDIKKGGLRHIIKWQSRKARFRFTVLPYKPSMSSPPQLIESFN